MPNINLIQSWLKKSKEDPLAQRKSVPTHILFEKVEKTSNQRVSTLEDSILTTRAKITPFVSLKRYLADKQPQEQVMSPRKLKKKVDKKIQRFQKQALKSLVPTKRYCTEEANEWSPW